VKLHNVSNLNISTRITANLANCCGFLVVGVEKVDFYRDIICG
jgi:hypothetical protein